MSPIQVFVLLVLALPLLLAAFNRLRIDFAALGMAVLLGLAQFAGFAVLGPANTLAMPPGPSRGSGSRSSSPC